MKKKKKIPIEKALKKYAVNALEEDHVRAFSRKKDPSLESFWWFVPECVCS